MRHGIPSSLRRRQKMKYVFIGSLFLMSLSIAFMPIASEYRGDSMLPTILTGLAFWAGLIGTILIAICINRCRKKSPYFNELYPNAKQLGIVHFFQSKPATVVDITTFVALLGLIITRLTVDQIIIPFVFLAIFVFLFGMHCMLNGICYKYLNYRIRRGKES